MSEHTPELQIPEPIPVPSAEEIAEGYIRAASELEVRLPPDLSLGKLLARLDPPSQYILRSAHGLFPASAPRAVQHIARAIGESPKRTSQRLENLSAKLAGLLAVRGSARSSEHSMPLEDIALLLNANLQTIPPQNHDFMRAYYGLPPYRQPDVPGMLQARYGLSKAGTVTLERKIIRVLKGGWATILAANTPGDTRISKPVSAAPRRVRTIVLPADEQMRLFRLRDASLYAEMLLALMPHTEDGEMAIQGLRESLVKRGTIRGARRKLVAKPSSALTAFGSDPPMKPEARSNSIIHQRLDKKRAFNASLETADGREELVAALVKRAAALTPADALALQEVVDEGRAATDLLVRTNIPLSVFLTLDVQNRHTGRAIFGKHFDAAFLGLKKAVEGFDPGLGFAFSSFAVATIRGYILRGIDDDQAARKGMPAGTWRNIKLIHNTEERLRLQLGRPPTDEEIVANSSIKSLGALRRYRKLETMSRTVSLDGKAFRNENGDAGVELYDVTGLREYQLEQTAADANDVLAEALGHAFTAADIDERQQAILRASFGMPPYGQAHAPEEIAELMGLSKGLVRTQYSLAKEKLLQSEAAAQQLAKFLMREEGA